MSSDKIPETDSIQELAQFWDAHDLTDFQDQLTEVQEPVFERATVVTIHLQGKEAQAVKTIADGKGVSKADLIRQWVLERIHR